MPNYTTLHYVMSDNLFKGIEKLSKLKNLKISGTTDTIAILKKKDMECISKLKELETIYISISSHIGSLDKSKYDVIELKCLQGMDHLTDLCFRTANRFDLTGIGEMVELKKLDIYGDICDICNEDLNCLKGLKKLELLSLHIIGTTTMSYINNIEQTERRKFSLKGIEDLINLKEFNIKSTGFVKLLDKELAENIEGLKFQNYVK